MSAQVNRMPPQPALNASDILRLAGETAADKVGDILALNPTLEEFEEALVWTQGDGDILARQGRPLTGKVAALYEILQSDQENEEPQ
jgi:hypothetical protein